MGHWYGTSVASLFAADWFIDAGQTHYYRVSNVKILLSNMSW